MAEVEPSAENDYQVGSTITFDRARWNAVMLSIATRLKAREVLEASFEALIAGGTQAALDVISANVAPQLEDLIEQINALEEQLEDIIGGGTAPNALQLGGQNPSYYLALANATGMLPVAQVSGLSAMIDAAVAALVNGSPAALDTLKELSDALGGDASFAANVAASLGNRLRVDAAQGLSSGQIAQALANLGGTATGIALLQAASTAAARTALQIDHFNRPRSRLINGSFWINQRAAGVLDYNGVSGYHVDRWQVGAASGGTLRVEQIVSQSPGGSPTRLKLTVQSTKASLAAGDIFSVTQYVEGSNIADAAFGTAEAKNLIYRIGLKASVAGTAGLAFRNAGATMSYVAGVTITPGEVGQNVVKTVVIPAAVAGTWDKSSGAGISVWICFGVGTTYAGAAGWNSGNFVGLAGQTNFMASGGATIELFDAGLYVDHAGAGIVPPFELVNLAQELRACQRYYQTMFVARDGYGGGFDSHMVRFMTTMRAAPSVGSSGFSSGNLSAFFTDNQSVDGFRAVAQIASVNPFNYSAAFIANAEL